MCTFSLWNSVRTYKSLMKLSHGYAALISLYNSRAKTKTQKLILLIQQLFLCALLFKMGVEIRCVARPPFTLLLDRNLSDSLFRSASGGVTRSTIWASAVRAQRDNHAILSLVRITKRLWHFLQASEFHYQRLDLNV